MTTETTPPDADAASRENKTAVSGLFGRDLVYMAFWSAQLILVACVTPVLTRILAQDELGLVAASLAVMQLLNILFSFGLRAGIQREFSGPNGDRGARQLVTLSAILALLTGTITYIAGPWWSPLIGLGHFPPAVRYAVIWSVLIAVTTPALALMRSRDEMRRFIAISFTVSIFEEVLSLALVLFVRPTAAEYLLGQTIGQLIAVVMALVWTRPVWLTRERLRMCVDALKFSGALVPAMIAGFVSSAADRIVIHADLGARLTSHYAVSTNIGSFSIELLGFLDFVWLPRLFALRDPTARREVLGITRDGLSIIGAAFAVAISWAAPLLLVLWAPPSYDPTSLVPITAITAAGALPFGDGVIYTQALILVGRTRAVALATVVAALVNLILNLLLVPSLGITGSAAITLFSYTLYAIMLRRLAGSNGPPATTRHGIIVGASVAICVCSALVPSSGVMIGVRAVVVIVAGLVFVARLLTLIKPDVVESFQRWFEASTWGDAIARFRAR